MSLRHTILLLLMPSLACTMNQHAASPKPSDATATSQRIPIERVVPDAVFQVPGAPDWIAVDDDVWVSNEPKDSISRLDPRANKVAAVIQVGKQPSAGLAAGFGSLWVPNCGDSTLSRIDLASGRVTATIPMMTPSAVSVERVLFARIWATAIFQLSLTS